MDKKNSKKTKVDPVQKSVLQLFADWMATSGSGQMFQVNSTESAFVIKVMTPDEMKIMQKEAK